MTPLRSWIRASRPLAQANIAPPILFGAALAYDGALDVPMLIAALAFGVLDHLFIVYANDYADRESDGARTLFSGGSGVLVEGALEPRSLLRAALVMFASMVGLSLALSLGLVFEARPWMLALCAAAGVLLWAYSFAPLRLSHRGGGELLQGVGVGAVLPLLGFYLQRGDFALDLRWLAAGALLAASGNIATALPDVQIDREHNKRTLVVAIERRAAGMVSALMVVASALLMLTLLPPTIDIGTVALMFAIGLALAAAPFARRALVFVVLHGFATQAIWLGVAYHLTIARG